MLAFGAEGRYGAVSACRHEPAGGFVFTVQDAPGFARRAGLFMFAVIKTGGKQYRVAEGDVITVEKLEGEPGGAITLDQVLMLADGASVTVGAPVVAGARVLAELLETAKGEKVKVFKKRRRSTYRRKRGHRQLETTLRITGVVAG
jgi:large subunit ribosomal protein L21